MIQVEEIDALELFRYVIYKFYLVVIILLLTLIIGNVYSKNIKEPLYKSYTTVVLVSETEKYTQSDLTLNKNLVTTYSNIIKSKTVLNKIIDNLKLDYSYQELYNMVSVSGVSDTEIIKITVSSVNNKEAVAIANAIVPVFSNEVERIYGIENVGVIDRAEESKKPYNINLVKENIVYSLIGFVVGLSLVFVMYYFDTTIKSVEEVEDKLGLTVLGVIPKLERRK